MKLKDLLTEAIVTLKNNAIDTASLDARLLLQHMANLPPEIILLYPEREIDIQVSKQYMQLIERRVVREPVAKIIGSKAFWLSDFVVSKHTLDPRPDSEVIISAALKILVDKNKAYRFLDLGTGSGCLLLSLLQEFPKATGVAVDISSEALKVAQLNANLLMVQDRVVFLQQNWGDSLVEKFDLIVSNPPYIPREEIACLQPEVRLYDPSLALDGGVDGLDPYRYLAKQILPLLKPEACAILEFGYGQSEAIKEIFIQESYKVEKILLDIANHNRAIIVKA